MNKDEALWVVVRAIGLVFLVLTIIYLAKLVYVGVYYIYLSNFSAIFDVATEAGNGKIIAMNSIKSLLFQNLIQFVLYGISAHYFMRRGKFVHKAISK